MSRTSPESSAADGKKQISVAVVGTQGVPATYGGFESLVENLIGENCPPDVHYTVFCSGKDILDHIPEYKGATLKYIPLKANGIQSVPYDMLSLCKCLFGSYDVILVLGVSGGLFLPIFNLLNSKKLIINIDGQEYMRPKWNRFAKWILRISEKLAVKYADFVIADNKGIQEYVARKYGRSSELICYGGDHVQRDMSEAEARDILRRYDLEPRDYAIAVCRIEPENNCDIVLDAFSRSRRKLVYIGNWNNSEYGLNLKQKYAGFENIRMLDAIYDLDVLYALRANASVYVHGHSAGGTNPSLVEAMFFGIPIASFDVVYNRETTEGKAYYFNDADGLLKVLERDDLDGADMKEIALRRYTWKSISSQYSLLYRSDTSCFGI